MAQTEGPGVRNEFIRVVPRGGSLQCVAQAFISIRDGHAVEVACVRWNTGIADAPRNAPPDSRRLLVSRSLGSEVLPLDLTEEGRGAAGQGWALVNTDSGCGVQRGSGRRNRQR